MKLSKRTLALLVFALSIAACGQSGPLYIPGNPSQVQEPPPEQEPPDEDDDEKSENDR